MKFNLLESEVKKIIELTYLGLYVLTNVKADKNWTEYESLSRKFIKYYIKNTKKMKMRLQGVKKKIAAKEFHAKTAGNVWMRFMKACMKRWRCWKRGR